MKPLAPDFRPYLWAPSTEELARRAGLDPSQIVRFDGNVPPLPLPGSRPAAVAHALAHINEYPHGGYRELTAAIAAYAGVEPENVVLGAGADDLILLIARAFAGPGDTVAIANDPTYPLYRDRGGPRRRDDRRRRSGADVLLPPEQSDRLARPAPGARGRSSSTRRTSSSATTTASRGCSTTA